LAIVSLANGRYRRRAVATASTGLKAFWILFDRANASVFFDAAQRSSARFCTLNGLRPDADTPLISSTNMVGWGALPRINL
jgi:hypothetical protein